MITKFRLYESEQNMKWFYHATKPEYLPSIVKHGILPNTDRKVNWGHFEEWSRGKAFVTNWYAQAIFYGQIINHYNKKFYPILRVKINPDDLIKDEQSACDFYSTEPIRGDFQIYDFIGKYYDDESWRELTPELAEILSENDFDDLSQLKESVVSWEELKETVPNSVYLKAKEMYTNVEGKTNLVGDSEVVDGWWIETHTLGCRNAADEAQENWVDSHLEIFDEYSKDGISYVVPAEDFIFVTLTPQNNLSEGLISSTPVKKTFKIFKRKYPDYYIGLQTSGGDIVISSGRKEYIDDLHGIDNLCRQLGWFISHGNIPSDGLYYKYNEPEFFDQKYEEVIIKPKFDEKDLPGKPSILYHVTPKRSVEKILQIGLVPKHKDKLVYHPDRVYLIDELELAYGLKKEFQRLDKIEYDILKIKMKDLDIKLYADVDYPQHGFYTLENIPPKFISILPKEEYRKHWESNNKNQSY